MVKVSFRAPSRRRHHAYLATLLTIKMQRSRLGQGIY